MKFLRLKYILVLAMAAISFSAFGQTHTGYFLQGVPQRHYINPAFDPECNFYLGMPILSSLYVENYNNSVTLADIFWTDPESGNVIHPLHPSADVDDFLSNFQERNIIGTSVMMNLASFGFRAKSMYFTLDVTSRTHEFFAYPYDLMRFLLKGSANGETIDMSGLGLDLTERLEVALGITKEFNSQFTVGIKPKWLKGVANVSAYDSHIELFTSTEQWVINSNAQINMSIPGMTYPLDEEGNLDLEGDFVFDSTLSSPADARKLAKGNNGFGFDLGFQYNPIPEIELSASIIDVGYIKWTNNTYNAKLNGEFTFEGVEYNSSDTLEIGEGILDSLQAAFEFTGEEKNFTTNLTPKIFVGGRFFISKGFDVGVLSRIDLLKGGPKANLVLSANWRPSSIWALSASYSPVGGTARTFGLGTSFRMGPFNLYLISDFFPSSTAMIVSEGSEIPLPQYQSDYNLRVGLNLVFGCNKDKKLRKDKPMYYSAEY